MIKKTLLIKAVINDKGENATEEEMKKYVDNVLNKKDLYDILQVNKNATQDVIKLSYKKISLKIHPDRNTNEKANEAFGLLNEAYEILKDEKKRSYYDEIGIKKSLDFSNLYEFFDSFKNFGKMFERTEEEKEEEERLNIEKAKKTIYNININEENFFKNNKEFEKLDEKNID